jgi:MFS family permease
MRAWGIALLVFSQQHQPSGMLGSTWSPTVIAMVANLLGLPAIIITNEVARHYPRPQVITVVMLLSALTGLGLGWSLDGSFALVLLLVLLYGCIVPADSGAINAGLVAATPLALRGATMALHALCGFTGAFLGPLFFGTILDLGGGTTTRYAWIMAFGAFTVVACLGVGLLLTTAARSPRVGPAGRSR